MSNIDLRMLAKANGICLWEIAYKLGITDSHFSRKLRRELPDEEKSEIKKIIMELGQSRKEAIYG